MSVTSDEAAVVSSAAAVTAAVFAGLTWWRGRGVKAAARRAEDQAERATNAAEGSAKAARETAGRDQDRRDEELAAKAEQQRRGRTAEVVSWVDWNHGSRPELVLKNRGQVAARNVRVHLDRPTASSADQPALLQPRGSSTIQPGSEHRIEFVGASGFGQNRSMQCVVRWEDDRIEGDGGALWFGPVG